MQTAKLGQTVLFFPGAATRFRGTILAAIVTEVGVGNSFRLTIFEPDGSMLVNPPKKIIQLGPEHKPESVPYFMTHDDYEELARLNNEESQAETKVETETKNETENSEGEILEEKEVEDTNTQANASRSRRRLKSK